MKTSDVILIICMLVLIIVIPLALYLGLLMIDPIHVKEFCKENGYAGVQMLNLEAGYCFSYTTKQKRYFSCSNGCSFKGDKLK